MSVFFYGGSAEDGSGAIMLVRTELRAWRTEAEYAGPDRLGDVDTVTIRGTLNREVNAYDWGPGTPMAAVNPTALARQAVAAGVPTRDYVAGLARLGAASAVGTLPAGFPALVARVQRTIDAPTTFAAIKDRLMQPRRQLIWLAAAQPAIVCPTINADGTPARTDARNGPTPISCDLVANVGCKSFVVDFTFQIRTNQATHFAATPSVILSHRFATREEYDQDLYTVRTTTGEVYFRSDRLAYLGAVADDFRGAFWHPRPAGFKRTAAVEASPDGTSLAYTIIDRELALSVVPPGVTRIEAWQTVDGGGLNHEVFFFDALGAFQDAAKSTAGAILGAMGLPNPFGVGGGVRNPFANAVPKTTIGVTCRVWGRPFVLRKTLENVALRLVLSRFNTALAGGGVFGEVARVTAGTKVRLTHDVAGTYVECSAEKSTAIPLTAFTAGALAGAALPNVAQFFPLTNSTAGILQNGPDGNGMDLRLPDIAGGRMTRGTYLTALATAALLGQDAVPASPPVSRDTLGLSPP